MNRSDVRAEMVALDEAIRVYAKRWAELQDDPIETPTVQGWIVSVEFTNFALLDEDAYGTLLISPDEQMAATSRGLAEIARDKYGR